MRKLSRKFYSRPTIEVAIGLLGCRIISNTKDVRTGGMIVETEAYIGEDDPACHAFHGLTNRTRIMYGPPGHLYVYFTYGNHFMLNVVTGEEGFPSAVLLRAIEPLYGIEEMARRRGVEKPADVASGPGKLARALAITGVHNGADLLGTEVYIIGPPSAKNQVMVSPRVGIGDRGSERLWRFFLAENRHVSRVAPIVREKAVGLRRARKMSFLLEETVRNRQ